MKKKLNTEAIINELRGGSAFFPGYEGVASPAPAEELSRPQRKERLSQEPNARSPERSSARTPVRDVAKRAISRNSFEIYEDQMEFLRKLSFRDKMEGKPGSMTAVVREAIDAYKETHPIEK